MKDDAYTDLILVVPAKADDEREAVIQAWKAGGGKVSRLGRFWEPPCYQTETVRLYGNSTFCEILAQKLSLKLVSPVDELLSLIDERWLNRQVAIIELSEINGRDFPLFAKSLVPKLFRSAVYPSTQSLENECQGLDGATKIVTSSVVEITSEVRAFVLHGSVLTASFYEGQGELPEALAFIEELIEEIGHLLPATYVLDVAQTTSGNWLLLEANAAWGAGLNGCCPKAVARCLAEATKVDIS